MIISHKYFYICFFSLFAYIDKMHFFGHLINQYGSQILISDANGWQYIIATNIYSICFPEIMPIGQASMTTGID